MQALSSNSENSTTDNYVVRRDGSTAPLEISKIRKVVNWATQGIHANPIALEASLTTRLRSGITTSEIQDNLIRCALDLCSPSEPDWRHVAGRLHIWSLWKDIKVSRGFQYGHYARAVETKVMEGLYSRRILIYTGVELEIANSWINPDWDADYDYAGAVLLTKRYLLTNELPQEAFLTCALLIASVESENRLDKARKFYEAIARRQISLATPILANLRVPNGTLSSCFITAMDDNLESIFGTIHDVARISKNGGGVGVNVSRVRSTGSWVMGKKNASGGVIPWIKLLNDTAIAVNQGGRRAGAVTVSLDTWHLDLLEFLEMQTENGDQRRKAYDVFPQLVVSDEFMRRVEASLEWTLIDPYEVRVKLGIELSELWGDQFESAYLKVEACLGKQITLYQRVNARQLFKQIMRTQLETGMPYLWFKDTVNRANPNKHEGYIPSGNLCQESWSNVKPGEEAHTCLAAGTKVLTETGWKAIEECDQQRVLVPFLSDQDFTPVYHFETAKLIDNGVKDVYRLTLKNKRTIEATGTHKFLVRHGSQNRHRQWLTLDEIKVGDRLEIQVSEFPLPEFFSDWAMERFMEVISFDLCLEKVQKYHQTKRDKKTDKQTYRRTSEVVSIEYIGQAHVYDLNIKTAHHFIAEGIVVHNCNLVSINLANLEDEQRADICEIAVRILDNTIELTSPPFAASATHNAKYRTIGVGCMGLADWLAKRHLSYTHLQEISDLFEDIAYYCTAASMQLALERGAYPAFVGSEWSKGNLIGAKPVEWFLQNASKPERFLKLSQEIQQHGIRNSHITAIAPNTSSSLVQGCTASVLPIYSKFFYEKWAKGSVPIAPPYIHDKFWFYVENKTLDQKKVVQAIATIQQWIDTGISMELLFNLNAGIYFSDEPERCLTAVDIFETIMLAWKLDCKAIYYIRTVQKDSFKESNEQCIACAN
jgi:ribonucleotide reductase alpha subunit